jgi:CheY-like chemotaxis protein
LTTPPTETVGLKTAPPVPQAMRILAVDDDENELLLLQRAAKQSLLPIELRTVSNPADALGAIKRPDGAIGVDFVLLDIRMPAISGHELLATIKRKREFNHLPVFILSTSDQQSDIDRARKSGASSYFVKPVNINLLSELLKDLYGCWIRREVPAYWP